MRIPGNVPLTAALKRVFFQQLAMTVGRPNRTSNHKLSRQILVPVSLNKR